MVVVVGSLVVDVVVLVVLVVLLVVVDGGTQQLFVSKKLPDPITFEKGFVASIHLVTVILRIDKDDCVILPHS